MNNLSHRDDCTLITAILRKNTANRVLPQVFQAGVHSAVVIGARGTMVLDKWYQAFMPAMSPEQEVLEMIVPNSLAENVMQTIIAAEKLHLTGGGAIYGMECQKTLLSPSYHDQMKFESEKQIENPIKFKEGLVAIYCIVQKSKSESIARAAVSCGSPGPTIVFGQGRGIRERLGLLRIAISPEKELIRVVTDDCDAAPVFEAMVQEGKLDTPGMGFIYVMPVQKGLINISSVFHTAKHSASMQQIIRAIDDLKNTTEWRAQIHIEDESKAMDKKFLLDLTRLSMVVERGRGDQLVQAAMSAGAPGASLAYGREIDEMITKSEARIKVSKEKEVIEMTVSSNKSDDIMEKIAQAATDDKIEDLYLYSHPVPKALTYLG